MAWHNESKRHSLASKGIKTSQKLNPVVLNINKYMGKWYEIASLPAWFQKGCKCAIAEYTKKKDYIEVKNSCLKEGKRDFRFAKAYKTEGKTDQLDVYFNPFFKGNYKVEYIDEDYTTAIVGTNSKDYLWILSRSPNLSNSKINRLKSIAKEKGYQNLSKLKMSSSKCK